MVDLVTRADYKLYTGLKNSEKDAKIDQLVLSVSALVKTYCGISFVDYYTTNKTETFDIFEDVNCVFLDEVPVVSITSVKERGSLSDTYETLTTAAYEYQIKLGTGIVYRTTSTSAINFKKGFEAVEILYKSGYEDTPKDLELAVYDLITYYLKNEYKERQTIVNASIQNQTTNSLPGDTGFPDHIKRILDLYKFNV